MSAFIQLAHVGFHKCIGKIAHGLLHIYSPYIAELCGEYVTFSNFIFHLLTNTFSSHDLFPPPFHHMTLSPDRLPIVLTM